MTAQAPPTVVVFRPITELRLTLSCGHPVQVDMGTKVLVEGLGTQWPCTACAAIALAAVQAQVP